VNDRELAGREGMPVLIRSVRRSLGMRQTDLARALGVNPWTISRWERGVTTPSELARRALRRLLEVPDGLPRA
jgi:DNA-binding transcriptional regulator YiaG